MAEPAFIPVPVSTVTVSERIRQTSETTRPTVWAKAAALMVVVFVCQLSLAFRLNAHGDVTMLNRFFDADNAWYLVNFETGNQSYGSWGGRNLVHPNVANFIHPLVWLGGVVVGIFDRAPKAQILQEVSLAVAPAFAGIRSGLFFAALATAGFVLADALLATALISFAFSSVLFGCLPESFVISGACFAFYFLVVAKSADQGRVSGPLWVASGMFLSSATITNIVPFAIGLGILLFVFTRNWRKSLIRTMRITAAALAATALCFVLLTAAHGTFKGVGRRIGQLEEVKFNVRSMLDNLPKAIARSIVAVRPNEMSGTDEERKSDKVQIVRFTFRDDLEAIKRATPTIHSYDRLVNSSVVEWSVFGLIAMGLFLSVRVLAEGTAVVKLLFLVSALLLAFHWLLHSFFGLELFLYSQHWMVPLVIALACGCTLSRPYAWMARSIILVLLAAAAIQSLSIFSVLAAA